MNFLSGLIGAGSNLLGGILGGNAAEDLYEKQWKDQKLVLQNQIQWKTKDALKAGIHPVYALGAPAYSYSPMSVGDPGGSLASGIAGAGQSLMDMTRGLSTDQKMDKTAQMLSLENAGLQNDLLRTQIRRLSAPGATPGSGGAGSVMVAGDKFTPEAGPNANQAIQNAFGDLIAAIAGTVDFAKAMQNKVEGNRPAFEPWNPWNMGEASSQWLNDIGNAAVRSVIEGIGSGSFNTSVRR